MYLPRDARLRVPASLRLLLFYDQGGFCVEKKCQALRIERIYSDTEEALGVFRLFGVWTLPNGMP
jgi:hypothetical protein